MDTFGEEFADLLYEKSDGQINLEIYPGGQLGDSDDMVEQVQAGIIDFHFASAGHVGSFVPAAQVFLLHYIFPRDPKMEIVEPVLKHGDAVEIINDEFLKQDMKVLAHLTEGWQTWTANEPLTTPDDFDGLDFRTATSRLIIENYEAYGANPTPTPFGEVYSGLQLGMIEGQENPPFYIEDMNFHEVQDYLVKSYTAPFFLSLVTNPELYETLPDDVRNIVNEAVEEVIPFGYEWEYQANQEALERMEDELEIIELSEEELESFRELSKEVRDTFTEDIEPELGEEILETLLDDIEQVKEE